MRPGATAAVVTSEESAPLVVAHRGAWGTAPQNSLDAVADAVALGCDAIEIDVRRTVDGRLVIVHDAWVRLRPVGRLEHSQVQARMKVGQAPLLDDVLQAAAGRIMVDVELKERGCVGEAMAAVTRHLGPEQYVLTSFREEVLAQARRCAPEARTGLLVAPRRIFDLDGRVRAARADFVAPHVSLARRGALTWAAKRGLDTWVWTVNDRRALHQLTADPRVTAVITDRPERALSGR